jgi:hypothetical protein
VKLCASNAFVHTVNQIDRFSMNFTETISCRTKSSWSGGGTQLEALAVLGVEGLKQPVVVPTSELKASVSE